MQSEGRLLPGQLPRYKGVMDAYRTIIRQEGVVGLWTGLGPAVLRNSIINATELASYETAKEFLVYKLGVPDNLIAHFSAGAAAGLMATIIGNPVDVIKTRVMAARKAAESIPSVTKVSPGSTVPPPEVYRGAIDCVVQTFRNEGIMAFYQGVVPQFFRLTGWSIVMFVTFEQVKAFAVRTVGTTKTNEAK
jgi:solute carrier family 25 uncoupling protein 8/9